MSADNQVVILAHRLASPGASWKYAALVASDPFGLQSPDSALDYAGTLARGRRFWFEGPGASGRSREMAHLLIEEYNANGWILEYEGILFVECSEAEGSVWYLTIP